MHLAHHRANQTLNVAAIVRLAGRTPNDVDPFVPTSANEGLAPEICAVVDVNCLRQTGDPPNGVDFALFQPCRLVVNGVEEAEAYRKARRRIHRKVEADDHPREHVDGQRQPRPLQRSAGFLVYDDQIHERVIDLNHLERSRGLVLAGNRGRRFDRSGVSPFARCQPLFDFVDAGLDGSAIRQRPAMLRETQMNLFDQVGQRRALGLQINLTDRLPDQIVARLDEDERSLPPPPLSWFERLDSRPLTIDRDEPIERRPTDSELQCDLLDIAHLEPLTVGSTEELPDSLLSAAGLAPPRAIGATAGARILTIDAHFSAAPMANVRESNSQIKCT